MPTTLTRASDNVFLPMHPVYAILDGPVLSARGIELLQATESLLDGGVRLVQIRWKQNWTRTVFAEVQHISAACDAADATLIVNDRADIARLLNVGVHVGQDDLPPGTIRELVGRDCLLGYSTHNEKQFLAALNEPIDYVAVGPIYGTLSKDNPDPVVGTAELARLRPFSARPVVAIGGVTLERAPEVWRAGADSIAIIGDLYPRGCTPASIRNRASEWVKIAANEHCSR